MQEGDKNRQEAIKRFWLKYADMAHKNHFKDSVVRWMVIHAQKYIDAYPDIRLQQHTENNVRTYFETLGRKKALLSWQYLQTIQAIELLFCHVLHLDWVNGFDWL